MKKLSLCLLSLFLLSASFSHAQNNEESVLFSPQGQGTLYPTTYGNGGNYVPNPTPTPVPTPVPTPSPLPKVTPKTTVSTIKNTQTSVTTNTENNFFSSLSSKQLKIDVSGIGKSCAIGTERAISWTLVNNGVDIDTKEELQSVIEQAVKSDYRIRRILIKNNILEIDYLQPARLFGIIPINYLFKVTTNVDTAQTTVQNPKWLSFASTYHTQTSQALSTNLPRIFTAENLSYISKQSIYYKHSFSIAAISSVMSQIDVYPFANGIWICVIVPFFIIFLILFGLLFGYLLYFFAKRRKEKYIRRLKYGEVDERPTRPVKQFKIEHDTETHESLDDYIQSKRFK